MKRGIRIRLFQFAFRLLYNEFAFTYDTVSRLVSLGQWRNWQRSVLPYLDDIGPGVILELAHGTGALQVDLLRANYSSVAFDLSPSMGRIARRRLSRKRLSTDFVRGDALSLPFANGSFSAVVSTFPTAFILNPDCLVEIYRVLELRGRAIIVMSAGLEGRGPRRALIRCLYRITGQSTGPASSAVFQRAFGGHGLSVEHINVECEGSIIQLAVLRKAMPEVSSRECIGLAIETQA
ncbi:MAG: methyltransferase domain-containing protein [Chloroflexi bacterium]|nr:methyltransferase domain-containing protein [Chloroflexota bacterium]